MKIECSNCHRVMEIDEGDYQPGETVEVICRRCGEPLTLEIPNDGPAAAPVRNSADRREAAVSEMVRASKNVPAENAPATNVPQEQDDLEKARLLLEAERIKLEHRRLDQELELQRMQGMRNQSPQPQEEVVYKNMKSKTTAGILGILLGGIGAHKFYLGKTGMGVLYLLFCWTYIPGIIGLIEGIMYLTKSDEDFHNNCY